MSCKPVKLNPVTVQENCCVRDQNRWKATTLFEHAKGLEAFEIPLAGMPIGTTCWNAARSPQRLAEEIVRVMSADLDKPIILSDDGFVLDGWHRVTRALVEGRTHISAVRFEKDPEPDWIVSEDGQ